MADTGPDYDLIVIGAGHNALVSAAYAAAAGYRVCVVERRRSVGGAVSTAEIVPGYRFDLGGSAHILIRLTPIIEELELEQHGLEYLDVDPLFYAPHPDGPPLFFHRDAERTAGELDRHFPGEGEAYLAFLDRWRPFAETVRDAFLTVPSPWQLGKRFVFRRSGPDWKSMLQHIARPYGDVVDEFFSEERVKTPLVWMAAQSGPPPSEAMTAPFVLWHPLYHDGGIARPKGGSGELSQALARKIRSHGGTIHTGTPVTRILVENGRAVGVELADVPAAPNATTGDERFRTTPGPHGWAAPAPHEVDAAPRERITARAVLSGTHARETLLRLLPDEHRPPGARGMRTGNGFGAILRLALDGPVRYPGDPEGRARVPLQLLCRDRSQIRTAYGDYLRGEPSRDPPIVAMSFSAVDHSLAPPGHEVLWLWAQYYPRELAEGTWADIADREEDRLLDAFERWAPGTRDRMVGSLFQHPEWLEREMALPGANVMHLDMGIDQMFALRPFLGMSGYRTHLKGLYLTGASTHPGGGIMGASGRNAARVLLRDLDRKKL